MNPEPEIERGREMPASALPLAEALRDVRLSRDGAQPAADAYVSVAVAAAVRAAVDWLTADGFDTRLPRLVRDVGALELHFDAVSHRGVAASADVLESVDGHLGPAEAGGGGWILRTPLVAERDTFLMVEQGGLGLAVPWHSVVRVRLLPAETIAATARRHEYAVLEPFAPPTSTSVERPVVLIGLGLRRALLVADRLVWRMPADRIAVADTPAPGLLRAVRTEEGEGFWVVEPRHALHHVAPMRLPAPTEPPRRPSPPPERLDPKPAEPERPRILVLRPEDVEPFGLPETPIPAEAPAPVTPEAAVPVSDVLAPELAVSEVFESIVLESEVLESEVLESALPEFERPESAMPAMPSPDVAAPMAAPPVPIAAPVVSSPPPALESAPPPQARAPEPTTVRESALESLTAADLIPTVSHAKRALVAEDSITARIFLTRLLEQRGFSVHPVASARELGHAASAEQWTVVFADVELPDRRGSEFLTATVEQMRLQGGALVALVRDAADAEAARAAGVGHSLRKPFESDALDRLLVRIGVAEPAR